MKKNKISSIWLLFIIIFCIFSFGKTISIAEDNIGTAGFSFSINYPDNQLSDKGYLDLLMKPNQKSSFTLNLVNPSSEDVNVDISITGAKTNKNGVIEYTPNDIKNDDSLKFPFEKIVTGPNQVLLKPGETKDVKFDIVMPDSDFDGQIVGGISMIRSTKDDKNEKVEGTQIKNRYRYVAPVVLQVNKNEVLPKLEFRNIYPEQLNAKNTIFITYSNINATFFNDMSVEVSISKKGKDTVLYQTRKNNMRMAPNSLINFPVSMQGDKMEPGNYTANITVRGDKGIIEHWKEDFKISKDEADKYNERDVGLYEERKINWKLIIIITLSVIILVIIIYFILTKINNKKKSGNLSRKKNKKKSK